MRATRFVIIALLLAIAAVGPAWGQGRVTVGQQVLYGFAEGSGSTVADVSGVGTPLNLTIADPLAVTWIPGGGLTVDTATRISSGVPATKLINAVMATDAITVEAWVSPANTTQNGPARIVTLSTDAYGRNVTLGQGSAAVGSDLYSVRLRTTTSDLNGVPELYTAAGSLATTPTHVVYTRETDGTTRIYLNGAPVQTGTNGGDLSNWDATCALGLGNEFVDERPWLGTFHLVAVFDRALAGVEVAQNFSAGPYLTPQPPTIVVHPADATVHTGQSAEFSVVAAGSGPLSYRWQRNQVDIPDAASSGFNTGPTVLADDGAMFRTVVTNDQGQAISDEAVLTVQEFSSVVRIMPCGDSITNGGAGSTDDAGYRRSLFLQLTAAGHTVELVGTMTTGIPVDFDRDHEGHDGWRADQIRDNIYNWLTLNPAEIVLLHIGTNDISGGNQDVQEVADILTNIDQWEADHAAPITVVLARIILRTDSLNPQTIAFNDAVETMALARIGAGDDIVLVDQETALTYPGDMADAVHPNNAGYVKMADTWFVALNAMLPLSGVSTVGNVTLTASSPGQWTTDDLTCTYTLNGDAVTAATAWTRNGVPEMAFYLPMEGGEPGALIDRSGHAIVVGKIDNPAWNAGAGRDGFGAYVFDGSDGLGAGENFPVNSSYTKCAWVYRTGSGANGGNNIISGDQDTGGHAFWAPDHKSNHLSAGHTGSAWLGVEDSVPLALNTWYFVAVSWDDATDLMILYKDGVEIDRATVTASVTDPSLFVGTFGANGYRWLGTIDEPRVYAHALPPEQIAALFTTGRDLIVSQETAVGEQWQAQVTPFSATEAGATVPSNNLTILSDSPLMVADLALSSTSGNNLTSDDLTATYTLAGGATTAATAWIRNGVAEMALYLPMEGAEPAALLDHSGNGLVVTKIDNPAWMYGAGHDGYGAYVFDGSDGLSAGENFPVNSSYTKSAWVYRTGSGANGGNNIISGDQNEGGHAFWAPDSKSNHLSAGHTGSAWLGVEDSVPLALNIWYFVAVTWDDASDLMILYKDGVEVDRATVTPSVTDPSLFVGTFGTYGYRWLGTIDDPRVYAHALPPAQIAALFSTGRDLITAAETMVGDQWQARVTPFSATEAGATVPSNTLTILPGGITQVENLALVSESGNNLPTDDLTCTYDLAGDAVTAATAWKRGGVPEMSVYLPMEGGATNALRDYSGSGFHGSPVSDPNWVATGGPDAHGCFEFDGNDYIGLGSPMPAGGAYTKAVWVYWTPGAFMNNILSGNSGHALWVTSYPEGNASSPLTAYYLSAGHNDPWRAVKDATPFPTSQWVHTAVSYDPAVGSGTMILYRDGAEVARATGIAPSTDRQAFLGAFAAQYPIKGSLDDARIYLHALSAAQVASLYSAGRDVIVDEETNVGDEWQAVVTAFSTTDAGEPQASNVLTVAGGPALTNVALTSTSGGNVTSDDLTASYTLAGSATTAATAWTRNGAPIMNLYYPFEGGSGRALTDYSGGGHQGIPGSDPAWVADGGHDGHGGLVLDGNDYVDAGQCMSTGAYTKSAWVYWINNAATMNNILSGQNDHAFWIANTNGGERLTAGHHGAWFTVADPVLFVPQVWTFVAVTYDPAVAGGSLTLYKNGASVSTATGVTPTTDTRAYVGAFAGNYIMQGSVDDVRIHNRALSADQIQALYTGVNAIVAAETGVGDAWQAQVTPFSAEAAGPTIASNTVTIIDPLSGVDTPARPTGYALHGNVPNPFNPLTVIAYEMPVASQVSLRVFDISGRLIATLKEGVSESAGRHEVTWTGRDHSGRQVSAGVYFFRMEAGSFAQTRRMVLVK